MPGAQGGSLSTRQRRGVTAPTISMWGVLVGRSKPVTILTIRAMNKDEFDQD